MKYLLHLEVTPMRSFDQGTSKDPSCLLATPVLGKGNLSNSSNTATSSEIFWNVLELVTSDFRLQLSAFSVLPSYF